MGATLIGNRTRSGPGLRRQIVLLKRTGVGLRAQFAALGQEHARLLERFELLREATSDGLWDVELGERKLTDPANEFIWSDQVRRLVGYRNEQDLPNGLGSWTRLLHPDDLQGAMAAFTAHVLDRTGRTPYDVTYRLRCRSGEYRWFRALSHAQRPAGACDTALGLIGATGRCAL